MPYQYRYNWSTGNSKLRKDGTVSFGIPALQSNDGFTTCPNAGICAGLCYARQGRYQMPKAQGPRERNLWRMREALDNHGAWGWVEIQSDLIIDITNLPQWAKQIRIHDSGDFWTPEYMRAWLEIAANFPSLTFYCYTKMILDYQWHLEKGLIPLNMYMVQSVGGKQDAHIDNLLPHSRIFPTHETMHAAGYTDCTESDKPIYNGARLIGLVYHGNRKLTNNQVQALTQVDIGEPVWNRK